MAASSVFLAICITSALAYQCRNKFATQQQDPA
jgi:hypothetical protein